MKSVGLIESKGLVALFEAADYLLKNSPVEILGIKNLDNGYLTLGVTGKKEYVSVAIENAVNVGRRIGEIYASSVIEDPSQKVLEIISDIFKKEFDQTATKISTPVKVESEKSEVVTRQNKSKHYLAKKHFEEEKKTQIPKQTTDKNLKIEEPKSKEIIKPISSKPSSSTIERLRQEALGLTEVRRPENKLVSDKSDYESDGNSKIDFEEIDKMNVHKLRHYAREFSNFPIKGRQISRANRNELVELFKKMK